MPKYDDSVPTATTHDDGWYNNPVTATIMSSAAAAILGVGLAILLDKPLDQLWRWMLIGGLIPMALVLLRCTTPMVLQLLEVVSKRDFTGDGVVGRPHPVLVNPSQGQAEARRQTEAQYKAQFEEFVKGCATDTSLRTWEGKLSRAQYNQMRDALLGAGYAVWNSTDQRQGWRLVKEPEQIIREVWRV